MPAELVVEGPLGLLLVAYWDLHYTMRNWPKVVRSPICCIVCRVNIFLRLLGFELHCIHARLDYCRSACPGRCIAFMQFLDRVLLSKPPWDFLTRMVCFYWDQRPTSSWYSWYPDSWSRHWEQSGRSRCTETVTRWLGCSIWKIHFTWVLRQDAQTFPIALTFLACLDCWESSRAWNDWRLSLKTEWSKPLCRLLLASR